MACRVMSLLLDSPSTEARPRVQGSSASRCAAAARRKFLRIFPAGFADAKYLAWERNYKWEAHRRWEETLNQRELNVVIEQRKYSEVARRAVQIESHESAVSFEKIRYETLFLRRRVRRLFTMGLYEYLYSERPLSDRFPQWCETVAQLPRKQTRVLTWPVVTVFGFLALPSRHMFLKPMVTERRP